MRILAFAALLLFSITLPLGAVSSQQDSNKPILLGIQTNEIHPLDTLLGDFEMLELNVPDLFNNAKSGLLEMELGDSLVDIYVERNRLWVGKLKGFLNDGSNEIPVTVPEPITLKGHVIGIESSKVRLTISPDTSWVSGYIAFDDNWYIIEPRRKEKSIDGLTEHYLYTKENAGSFEGMCGTIEEEGVLLPVNPEKVRVEDSASILKIFGFGDFEYYNLNPDDWATRMISVFNDVEGIYEEAINVRFHITGLGAFTTSVYPFNTADAGNLLWAFKEKFRAIGEPQRQLLHILTGKYLDNGIIGAAWIRGMGRCWGTSLAQQIIGVGYEMPAYRKMILSAHEIGHNFGAVHHLAVKASEPDSYCTSGYYTIMDINVAHRCHVDYFSDSNVMMMESLDDFLNDNIPPNISLVINADNQHIKTRDVNVDYTIKDNVTNSYDRIPAIFIKNKSEECAFIDCPYSSDFSIEWRLSEGDGKKMVEMSSYDVADNLAIVSDTIILDQTPPTPVSFLHSTSHNVEECSSNRFISVQWESAFDQTSGLKGYSVSWDLNISHNLDNIVDFDESTQSAVSPELSDGIWQFNIKAIDSAGWESPVEVLGPFYINYTHAVDSLYCDKEIVAVGEAFTLYWLNSLGISNYQLHENGNLIYDGPRTDTSLIRYEAGIYDYELRCCNACGCDDTLAAYSVHVNAPTSTEVTDNQVLPANFKLFQNNPNPFNTVTEIKFALPRASHVKLDVFNSSGQKVTTIIENYFNAGIHTVSWSGYNVSSGVYIYQIKTSEFKDSKKMTLIK